MKTNARNNETRMALVRAFFSLLAEKPIDKVTVTDITLRCGVNRNTFYYHYRDVYDLYEGIVGLFARQLESVFSSERFDAKDAIGSIAKLAHAKRTVVYHIYDTPHRPLLEDSLYAVALRCAHARIRELIGEDELYEEHEFMARCGASLFLGFAIRWLDGRMEEDVRELVRRFELLFGQVMGNIVAESAAPDADDAGHDRDTGLHAIEPDDARPVVLSPCGRSKVSRMATAG